MLSFMPLPIYPRGKIFRSHEVGVWVGSRSGLHAVEKESFPVPKGNITAAVQPLA